MTFKKWDKPSLDILRALVDKGFSHPEISYIMRRTVQSIANKCSKEEMDSKYFVTTAESEVIKEMCSYGFSIEEMAKKIKRKVGTVRSACYELGLKPNSVQKATPEETKRAVQMLKAGASTRDVAKALPGWSASMAMHLKVKYKIVGLTRGGKTTVPKSEIDLVRELSAKNLTYKEIAVEMTKRLGRHITESLVRGRIRFHRIPHVSQRSRRFGKDWSEQEDSVLKSMHGELGADSKARAVMSQLLPGRNREAIRKRLSRVI